MEVRMARASMDRSVKKCGNCMFWGGERKPNYFLTHVEYDTNTKGVCVGKRKGNKYQPYYTCDGWAKWGVLK